MHNVIQTIHKVYGTGHFYAISILSEAEKYLCTDIALGAPKAKIPGTTDNIANTKFSITIQNIGSRTTED